MQGLQDCALLAHISLPPIWICTNKNSKCIQKRICFFGSFSSDLLRVTKVWLLSKTDVWLFRPIVLQMRADQIVNVPLFQIDEEMSGINVSLGHKISFTAKDLCIILLDQIGKSNVLF